MKRIVLLWMICCLCAAGAAAGELLPLPDTAPEDCEVTIEVTDGINRIEAGGFFRLCGQAAGQLLVDAKGSEVIVLLDGVSLTSPDGPAVMVRAAKRVCLIAAEGTQSTLTDSPERADGDEANAAVYSKADLAIGGRGLLTVNGRFEDGIAGKDALAIAGSLTVTAADDAIRGKDSLTVSGSTLQLTAGGDGLKATNDGGDGLGWIRLAGSDITIVAGADGVQAETSVTMESGRLRITAGGGWDEAHRRQLTGPTPKRERKQAEPTATPAPEADSKGKGIKAAAIRISGGEVEISARDDALHAADSICIEGGRLTVSSNDDGLHADQSLTISGGEITVTDAWEGLEAGDILLSGGTTHVQAIDDGWNAASKARIEAAGGKTYDFSLTVTGGEHHVLAGADGLDSNGNILVSGGLILSATTNTAKEVPLDYPMNCTCRITGGTVMIAGPYGSQTQNFNRAENQASLLLKWRQPQAALTPVEVQDAQGKTLLSWELPAAFQTIIASSPEIQTGDTYRVSAGGHLSGKKKVTEDCMRFPVTASQSAAGGGSGAGLPCGTLQYGTYPCASGDMLSYALYVPGNASRESLPLIVYLHGGSGKGDDIRKVLQSGFPSMLVSGQLGNVPAYALIPQCPSEQKGWEKLAEDLAGLIAQTTAAHPIDPDRVVLTGHSMGGTGAWSLASSCPQLFSCVIPMCGSIRLTDRKLEALSSLPVWAFTAVNDTVVAPSSTIAAMVRLTAVSPENSVTVFPTGGHRDVPRLAWLDKELGLLDWALSQVRRPVADATHLHPTPGMI